MSTKKDGILVFIFAHEIIVVAWCMLFKFLQYKKKEIYIGQRNLNLETEREAQ